MVIFSRFKEVIMRHLVHFLAVLSASFLLCSYSCHGGAEDTGGSVAPPSIEGDAGAGGNPGDTGGNPPEVALPEAVEPDLDASAEEIAEYWPDDLPKFEKSSKWELLESKRTKDDKHLRKIYLTSASTHEALRVFELELAAKGYADKQVGDSDAFAQQEFAKEGVYVIVAVDHDNKSGKNKVSVTVHLKGKLI